MKSLHEICGYLVEVKCEPYRFKLDCVVCVRDGHNLMDDPSPTCTNHVLYLQAMLWRKDSKTGEEGWGSGGKYLVSPHMTEGEIVKKCFVAARDYSEHEVREAFEYKGKKVLGPHISLEALSLAADFEEFRG